MIVEALGEIVSDEGKVTDSESETWSDAVAPEAVPLIERLRNREREALVLVWLSVAEYDAEWDNPSPEVLIVCDLVPEAVREKREREKDRDPSAV